MIIEILLAGAVGAGLGYAGRHFLGSQDGEFTLKMVRQDQTGSIAGGIIANGDIVGRNYSGGSDSTIVIDGVELSGSNLQFNNGRVSIDGKDVTDQLGGLRVQTVDVKVTQGVLEMLRTDGSATCGEVQGSVVAGSSVRCQDVYGDIAAGSSVQCGDVDGDVSAGSSITCGNISGSADAGSSITRR